MTNPNPGTIKAILRTILSSICLFLAVGAHAQLITVNNVTLSPAGPYCEGSQVTVSYSVSGVALLSSEFRFDILNNGGVVVQSDILTPHPSNTGSGNFSSTITFPSGSTGGNRKLRVTREGVLGDVSGLSATFNIVTSSIGGTVASSQSICSGASPANLSLGGQTGSVIKWQRSASATFTSGVTDIVNTSTTLTGSAIGALTATTYFRAVVQNGNCAAVNSGAATITVNTLNFPQPAVTNISCNNASDGKIVASATGVGTISYSISPSGGSQSPAGTFNNLQPNTYTITANDGTTGCTSQKTVTVTQPAQLTFSFTKADLTSCVTANGSITVTGSGGTTPYQYSKDNGVTFQPANVLGSLPAGNYAVKIKDANNCTSQTVNININSQGNLPSVNGATLTNATCSGGNNGSITFGGNGGLAPYMYSIDNGSTYVAGSNPKTFTGVGPGNYPVKVKDANGCESSANNVNVSSTFSMANGTLSGGAICEGQTGKLTFTASSGSSPFTLMINGNTYTNITSGTPFNVLTNPVTNTNYTLTQITDAHGCTNP